MTDTGGRTHGPAGRPEITDRQWSPRPIGRGLHCALTLTGKAPGAASTVHPHPSLRDYSISGHLPFAAPRDFALPSLDPSSPTDACTHRRPTRQPCDSAVHNLGASLPADRGDKCRQMQPVDACTHSPFASTHDLIRHIVGADPCAHSAPRVRTHGSAPPAAAYTPHLPCVHIRRRRRSAHPRPVAPRVHAQYLPVHARLRDNATGILRARSLTASRVSASSLSFAARRCQPAPHLDDPARGSSPARPAGRPHYLHLCTPGSPGQRFAAGRVNSAVDTPHPFHQLRPHHAITHPPPPPPAVPPPSPTPLHP